MDIKADSRLNQDKAKIQDDAHYECAVYLLQIHGMVLMPRMMDMVVGVCHRLESGGKATACAPNFDWHPSGPLQFSGSLHGPGKTNR